MAKVQGEGWCPHRGARPRGLACQLRGEHLADGAALDAGGVRQRTPGG